MKEGFVALVGAGPGDAGLFTYQGKQLLKHADAVVYDRQISEEILKMARKDAQMISAEKESRHHQMSQEKIKQILLMLAKEGKLVVRLKGGNPLVFGRGTDELSFLSRHGVRFMVVPGVSSAIAALAYAGIPVTHEAYSSSLHIITCQAKEGGKLSIPFAELSRLDGTLVFLMGLAELPGLARGLLKAGMDGSMPAAVVENGTRKNQRKVISTLSNLERDVTLAKIQSPAVVAVGKVCALSSQFDWFSSMPLFGATVAVTGPSDESSKLLDKLSLYGANVLSCPALRIRPICPNPSLDLAIDNLYNYQVATFSGKNAVTYFFDALYAKKMDARSLSHLHLAAVGEKTALYLKKYGITADLIPTAPDSSHMAREVVQMLAGNGAVLILDAQPSAGGQEDAYQSAGVRYTRVPLYETLIETEKNPTLASTLSQGPLYVLFTSTSAVEGFLAMVKGCPLENAICICIGRKTLLAAKAAGLTAVLSSQPTQEAMLDKLLELYEKRSGQCG